MRLFHISEEVNIEHFEPRPCTRKELHGKNYVWAISEAKLPNYLLPRDCPRISFFKSGNNKAEILMRGVTASMVIAIEKNWLPVIQQTTLYQYEMNPINFQLVDETAGYYVSEQVETPIHKIIITNILNTLLHHDIELRILPSLWELREQVIHSTLGFSIIRMRNATPPGQGYEAFYSV